MLTSSRCCGPRAPSSSARRTPPSSPISTARRPRAIRTTSGTRRAARAPDRQRSWPRAWFRWPSARRRPGRSIARPPIAGSPPSSRVRGRGRDSASCRLRRASIRSASSAIASPTRSRRRACSCRRICAIGRVLPRPRRPPSALSTIRSSQPRAPQSQTRCARLRTSSEDPAFASINACHRCRSPTSSAGTRP